MRLERLQNRVARLATDAPFRTPTNKLRLDVGWETLKIRREKHRLTYFHKLTHHSETQPNYIKSILPQTRIRVTGRNLRNANTHTLPANNTTSFQKSFVPKTTRKWNLLPVPIRNEKRTPTFKRKLADLLGCPSPPPYFSYGSKFGNSLHTKTRTGTIPINAYLYQYQQSESSACSCGFRTENIKHFILLCPLYQPLRNTLFRVLSETLRTDCTHWPSEKIMDLLLCGTSLNAEGGRRVAGCLQSYIMGALAARQAAAAGGGVVAQQ